MHADLRIGADVAAARPLQANAGLSSPGVKLHGAGFIVTRAEAAAMGLVNEVVAPEHLLDRTLEYAADLAVNASPTSMSVMKQQVYADQGRSIVVASDDAVELMKASLGRPDFTEGVASFLQKRPPSFTPIV